MKIAGIIFILCSTTYVGFQIARSFQSKQETLNQLLHCLQIIRNEIAFCGTSIPQIMKLLGHSCSGEMAQVFSSIAQIMEKDKHLSLSDALQKIPYPTDIRWLLPFFQSLCSKLGAYDMDAQLMGLEAVCSDIRAQLKNLEEEKAKKGKTYETLGICAGLALAILLI